LENQVKYSYCDCRWKKQVKEYAKLYTEEDSMFPKYPDMRNSVIL
jgi:hypothetical protein